jgi:hypothetical protein
MLAAAGNADQWDEVRMHGLGTADDLILPVYLLAMRLTVATDNCRFTSFDAHSPHERPAAT